MAGHGLARLGMAWHGGARSGKGANGSWNYIVYLNQFSFGAERPGLVRRDMVRLGQVGLGQAR